jgi:hypothetical protein
MLPSLTPLRNLPSLSPTLLPLTLRLRLTLLLTRWTPTLVFSLL